MTKKIIIPTCLTILSLILGGFFMTMQAQEASTEISGTVVESGTGTPLSQAAISVSSTGTTVISDEQGKFTLTVPDTRAEIIVDIPGYSRRSLYLNGRNEVVISMVQIQFQSTDKFITDPLGTRVVKHAAFAANAITQQDIRYGTATSFDMALQGKVPGLDVVEHSGMPGHRSFMNIRGYNSIQGSSEPLLFIDGMIHSYSYANNGLMDGFTLNPMDVVDIDDISEIAVMKDGNAYLGSAASNGVIYINTEQKSEASTVIKFAAYGGLSLMPKKIELLNPGQFNSYFEDMLVSQGYGSSEIDAMYPWLHGDASSEGYYKYNNETDWQDEIYSPATVSKFHFFLKGGDDIATYNVSTGYLSHNGILDNSNYNRFNLRINGRVNISDKFSITPNAKLSLGDSRVTNLGPDTYKNPIASALMKAPIMAPIARDGASGEYLTYYDDVGVFNVSNPSALVENAGGVNRNYHFLASIKAGYKFNEHFNLSTLFGLNFNNARESLFLPDLGVVQVDSAYNSPAEFVNEMRSTQNHTALTYTTKTGNGHSILANVGFRYMANSYKFNKSISLNTPSDEFKRIQDNAQYPFLRSTTGDDREIVWVSMFADAHYNYRSKYYLSTSLSYDGSSVTNATNRYNFYPSVAAAWRLSSESFLTNARWLEDLKLRGSYSITGNMFSTVYDYSKLYYSDRRLNSLGVLTREAIPNENLALETKNTINAGLDVSLLGQVLNIHADYFIANVNNLVVRQQLPSSYGFTTYYDNGGKMNTSGLELALDGRVQVGDFAWVVGGSVSMISSKITALDFIHPDAENIITNVAGAQFITEVDGPLNAFYGYETDGLVSAAEAGTIIGPKGLPLQEGDIKFVNQNPEEDNVVNEDDKVAIGDPNPDMYGSLYTSLSWKNFEFFMNWNYSMGNELYNHTRTYTESMSSYSNQGVAVLDRYGSSNTGAGLPRLSYGDPTGNNVFSDRWIEDGSYIRLAQVTLSYHFAEREGWYKGITLYATATNLLTLTNYTGYDPEVMYMNSPFFQGIDYGMMPSARTFIVGLKLDL